MKSLAELNDLFKQHGIDPSYPGFLDQPEFLRAEANDPDFLGNYGNYIKEREYSPEYLERARTIITNCCEFFCERIAADGKPGACINASTTISRFLEKQNIWNFVLKGGLTLRFRESLGIAPVSLAPINRTPGVSAGHVWVVAPPFRIVDVTVKYQRYRHGEECFLPRYVLEEDGRHVDSDVYDWVDPNLFHELTLQHGRVPDMTYVRAFDEDALERSQYYGAIEIDTSDVVLRFVGCAVGAIDGSLEEMKNLCLSGDYPAELYRQFCKGYSVNAE